MKECAVRPGPSPISASAGLYAFGRVQDGHLNAPFEIADERRPELGDLLDVFGRTPLFTYLPHVPLIHALALAVGMARGLPATLFTGFIADPKRLADAGWGIPISATYAVWIAVVLALWPAARWFAAIKVRCRD